MKNRRRPIPGRTASGCDWVTILQRSGSGEPAMGEQDVRRESESDEIRVFLKHLLEYGDKPRAVRSLEVVEHGHGDRRVRRAAKRGAGHVDLNAGRGADGRADPRHGRLESWPKRSTCPFCASAGRGPVRTCSIWPASATTGPARRSRDVAHGPRHRHAHDAGDAALRVAAGYHGRVLSRCRRRSHSAL